jgi:hypothetical protein
LCQVLNILKFFSGLYCRIEQSLIQLKNQSLAEKKFWTGTTLDGVTVNQEVIPLDIQAWALLALKEEGKPCLHFRQGNLGSISTASMWVQQPGWY